jgi:ribosomal protein S12 methylthiotransferase
VVAREVVPYLDMPIQHADDAIHRAMRRGVTARRMREIVAAFRQASPA